MPVSLSINHNYEHLLPTQVVTKNHHFQDITQNRMLHKLNIREPVQNMWSNW
jgi:hypothetical protein